jgi:hypothetical protein
VAEQTVTAPSPPSAGSSPVAALSHSKSCCRAQNLIRETFFPIDRIPEPRRTQFGGALSSSRALAGTAASTVRRPADAYLIGTEGPIARTLGTRSSGGRSGCQGKDRSYLTDGHGAAICHSSRGSEALACSESRLLAVPAHVGCEPGAVAHASIPIRHGGSWAKYAKTRARRSARQTTVSPTASTPCTWNTFFARSRPIVLTSLMDGSRPLVSLTTQLWHIDAVRGPSTPSNSGI